MQLRVLSYNIHKGVGWQTRMSTLDRIHQIFNEQNHDIIFLQEVLESQFKLFADDLWPHSVFGRNRSHDNSHLGNAILSKNPLKLVSNLAISMHRYEHRGALHTTIDINDKTLHLICLHLGLFPIDRRKQMAKIMAHLQEHVKENDLMIISGDFNDWANYATKPLKENFDLEEVFLIKHHALAKTFPAWSPAFKLDRIYYRGINPVSANRLITKEWKNLSDHLAIEATFEYE